MFEKYKDSIVEFLEEYKDNKIESLCLKTLTEKYMLIYVTLKYEGKNTLIERFIPMNFYYDFDQGEVGYEYGLSKGSSLGTLTECVFKAELLKYLNKKIANKGGSEYEF